MNTSVQWENEAKTVLRIRFAGDWDWNEFYAFLDNPDEKRHAINPRVCVLIDLRAVTHFPSDAILHLKRAAQLANAVSGMIIIIASSIPAATTYQLFITLYRPSGDRFRLVADDAEAYTALGMPI